MRCLRVAIVLLSLFGAAGSARALTGQDLYDWCITPKDTADDNICLSYVRGFIDGWVLGQGISTQFPNVKICLPDEGFPVERGRDLLEKYLRAHPEMMSEKGGYILGLVTIDALRCPSN
jgi:hypothetical protein